MTTLSTPSLARQKWLCNALDALKSKFEKAGYSVPEAIRVSIGFPKGSQGRNKTIGQCWATDASGDQHNEIFISPEIGGPGIGPRIMDVMAHELVHAVVGLKVGHKKPFKQAATAVGLTGKMTATVATDEFNEWAATVIERIGPYPAAAMSLRLIKKQTTRLLKCECEACGYTARVTAKWIDSAGAPICPTDQIEMSCDTDDE